MNIDAENERNVKAAAGQPDVTAEAKAAAGQPDVTAEAGGASGQPDMTAEAEAAAESLRSKAEAGEPADFAAAADKEEDAAVHEKEETGTYKKTLTIAFAGNPNCGKTTLFNDYTGANLKVANWPGVSVEKKEGAMKYHDDTFKLVDLPGTYSLTAYTMEETVSRNFILSDEVDLIIDIADASALERNLYLTLQLIELGKPVILALNMMDIVEKRGMEIDFHRLPEMLGIPCIPISARTKKGLNILMHAAAHHADSSEKQSPLIHQHTHNKESQSHHQHHHHQQYVMVYSDEIEDKIDAVSVKLKELYPSLTNYRWHAIKELEKDTEIAEKYPLDLPDVIDRSYEDDIITQKYDFIEEVIDECLVNKDTKEAATDRADRILTNRWLGLPIFLLIMAGVFVLTFAVGNAMKGGLEYLLDLFSNAVRSGLASAGAASPVISLLCDGIIAGVGGILTFLPNIFVLFLALAFLEDSGYMSRVAYVMDGVMGRLGLSGKAFIPMILGFGCTVPAIMASRALATRKDRFRTMLITPFFSCSAKLPIYVLFSGMFFPKFAGLAAFSLYAAGFLLGLLVAFLAKLFDKEPYENDLLIELPEYKRPSSHTIFIYVWEKVKDYLTRAGTIIFITSIVMWFILNFGPSGFVGSSMENSFGSLAGKAIVPVFVPLGLGYWQIVVALIAGISAKEVVVSSCAVLFGISNVQSAAGMSKMVTDLSAMGFGPLNAYCLMVFCLLYVPCIAAMATIRRESGSRKYTAFVIVFQLAIAWVVTFIIFQVGRIL